MENNFNFINENNENHNINNQSCEYPSEKWEEEKKTYNGLVDEKQISTQNFDDKSQDLMEEGSNNKEGEVNQNTEILLSDITQNNNNNVSQEQEYEIQMKKLTKKKKRYDPYMYPADPEIVA